MIETLYASLAPNNLERLLWSSVIWWYSALVPTTETYPFWFYWFWLEVSFGDKLPDWFFFFLKKGFSYDVYSCWLVFTLFTESIDEIVKSPIWFYFKEGHNNAVRKTLRMQDLLNPACWNNLWGLHSDPYHFYF